MIQNSLITIYLLIPKETFENIFASKYPSCIVINLFEYLFNVFTQFLKEKCLNYILLKNFVCVFLQYLLLKHLEQCNNFILFIKYAYHSLK